MKELAIIVGAAALFCVLVFGAAYLAAGWMNTGPRWWRRPLGQKRRNRRD